MNEQALEKSVVKICTTADVEQWTSQGWYVAEIREEERVEGGVSYREESTNAQGYMQSVGRVSPFVPVKKLIFVLYKTKEDILQEMRNEVMRVDWENKLLQQKQTEATALLEMGKKELARANQTCSDASEALKQVQKQFSVERGLRNKLEEDIAKIRQELGEARMREILSK